MTIKNPLVIAVATCWIGVSVAAGQCGAGLVEELRGCYPCPPGTFKGENDFSCLPCPAGFQCDYILLPDTSNGNSTDNATTTHTVYDTGGWDGDYKNNEKYYQHFTCPPMSFMTVKIHFIHIETGYDYMILSKVNFTSDFRPDNTINKDTFVYVGNGESDWDESLPREIQLAHPDLYLMFYSDEIECFPGFHITWKCTPATGATRPISCGVGEYAGVGTALCRDCEQGYYCPTTDEALLCPAGQFSNTTKSLTCSHCEVGQYSPQGATACRDCEQGYYCPTANVSLQCPLGTNTLSTGATSSEQCLPCGAGMIFDAPAVGCRPCPPGTFKGENDSSCRPCPAGFQCNYIPGRDIDNRTGTGNAAVVHTVYDTGGWDGDYQGGENYYHHFICSPGSFMTVKINYLDTNMAEFVVLSNVTFAADFVPYFLPENWRESYIYVGSGLSDDDPTLLREIQLPDPDVYLMFYSTPHENLPWYSRFDLSWQCVSAGAVLPVPCNLGEYSMGGTAACSDCEQGFYCPTRQAVQPSPCPAGTFSNITRSTTCLPCEPGRYSNGGASMCFPCEGEVPPLPGFHRGFNCTFLVPSTPSAAVQNAAYHSAVAASLAAQGGQELTFSPKLSMSVCWEDSSIVVTCDQEKRVTEIKKSAAGFTAARGEVEATTLFQSLPYFTSITSLDLGRSEVPKIPLPPQWMSLSRLTLLDCEGNSDGNGFYGPLPQEWAAMTKLQRMDLSDNQITGSLPHAWATMIDLQELKLRYNQLEGSLPPEWGTMTSLQMLLLDRNHLQGSLPPEWGTMTSLKVSLLNSNHLQGTLPPVWSAMTRLQELWVDGNGLEGSIPVEWAAMASLRDLKFDESVTVDTDSWYCTRFPDRDECTAGRELSEIHDTVELKGEAVVLIEMVESNPRVFPDDWRRENTVCFWSGIICEDGNVFQIWFYWGQYAAPTDIAVLSLLGNLKHLKRIELPNSRLHGTLPSEWAKMTSIEKINLEGNQLTGFLPAGWSAMTGLQVLYLSSNQLGGTLPPKWSNMTSLVFLDLSHNDITGTLPNEWVSSWLDFQKLDVSYNQIAGTIPIEYSVCLRYCSWGGHFDLFVNYNLLTVNATDHEIRYTIKDGGYQYSASEGEALSSLLDCIEGPKIYRSLPLAGVEYDRVGTTFFAVSLTWEPLSLKLTTPAGSSSVGGETCTKELMSVASSLPHLRRLNLRNLNLVADIQKLSFASSKVTEISLNGNFLMGKLPRLLPPSVTTLDLSHNELSDCINDQDRDCFLHVPNGETYLSSLVSLDLSRNNLYGELNFDSPPADTDHFCPHENLTRVDLSGNPKIQRIRETMLTKCPKVIFLTVDKDLPCPLPSSKKLFIIPGSCFTDYDALYHWMGIEIGVIFVLATVGFLLRRKLRIQSLLKYRNLKLVKYFLSYTLNVYDTVMDVVVYLEMIDGVVQSHVGVTQLCTVWNTNMDAALSGLTSLDPEHTGDWWKYQDTMSFFQDPHLLSIQTNYSSPWIKTPINCISMLKGLNVFPNNTLLVDAVVDEYHNTCVNSTGGNYCYMDPSSYECIAYDRNKYVNFLQVIYVSIAVVALKEAVKFVLIMYLMCCYKTKGKDGDGDSNGVPRSLRAVVVASVLHPLLLLVLPNNVYVDQLMTNTMLYQDELVLLFMEVVLENFNQLFMGAVYMSVISQRGISWAQMLLYPVQVLQILFTLVTIVKGRQRQRQMSRAVSPVAVGGVTPTVVPGSGEGSFEMENKVDERDEIEEPIEENQDRVEMAKKLTLPVEQLIAVSTRNPLDQSPPM